MNQPLDPFAGEPALLWRQLLAIDDDTERNRAIDALSKSDLRLVVTCAVGATRALREFDRRHSGE